MIKKDERCRFTLRLPKELFERIQFEAERKGLSMNSIILEILWDWSEKNNTK